MTDKDRTDEKRPKLSDMLGQKPGNVVRGKPVEWPTLRDQFAMAALTGIIANPENRPRRNDTSETLRQAFAFSAYSFADAMLKEREKPAD